MKRQPIKTLAVLALGLFFCFQTQAQSGYDDYRALDKVFKYREDFGFSSSKWETSVEGKSEAKIRDGALVFKSINDRAQAKYTRIEGLDWSEDWELEIGARWINGKENSSVDFIWDRTPGQTRKYHFGFTAARKYNIAEYNNGYQQIVGFTKADYVYRTTRNRLTVRHVNGYYYFFVNERFVKKHRAKQITGNYVGFMVPPGSTIAVDYLYVRQLKKKTNNYSASSGSSGSGSSTSSEIDRRGGYIGVMTKYNGYSTQRWKTRDNWPKDEIKSDWNSGYSISDLSYDNNKWSLIMSKGTGYSTQTWMTRREWKKEDIKEKWDQGYKITEVNYGNGVYGVVFSKNTGYGRQRWATKVSGFPSDKIREFGQDGLKITELIYGEDRWVLVASADSRIKNQKWFKRTNFPKDDIATWTKQGYSITQLSKENGWWVLVMSEYYSGSRPTVWFRTTTFPKDKIREYWDKGYYLTDLTYTKPKPSSSSSNYSSNSSTNTSTTAKPVSSRSLKTRLLGKWYGGAEANNMGYMTFYTDNILKMVTGGETIGGYDYSQNGVRIDVKYELNSFNTPNQFDIVFYSGSESFGKMKGIIRFKDDDTFELKIAQQLNDSRPSSFTSTTSNKVSTFRRVN